MCEIELQIGHLGHSCTYVVVLHSSINYHYSGVDGPYCLLVYCYVHMYGAIIQLPPLAGSSGLCSRSSITHQFQLHPHPPPSL